MVNLPIFISMVGVSGETSTFSHTLSSALNLNPVASDHNFATLSAKRK